MNTASQCGVRVCQVHCQLCGDPVIGARVRSVHVISIVYHVTCHLALHAILSSLGTTRCEHSEES